MKELLEMIARALVDQPDNVQVRATESEETIVFELRVHPSDNGKVIGHQGKTVESIRTIMGAAGVKLQKRVKVEILE